MAVYYAEFDTTVQNLVSDLKTRILLNPDWSWQGLDTQLTTSTVATAVNATTMTFASGSIPASVVVGSIIRIDSYGSGKAEYRTVTAITATVITWVGGLSYAHAIGTPIFWGSEVVRSTTVRGAPMILDLTGGIQNSEVGRKLATAAYNGYTPPTTTTAPVVTGGSNTRSAYFRRLVSSMSNVCHVILSTSKDHIYISVEGPRFSEANPAHTSFGSSRSYVFMSDLVPYSPNDTVPAIVYGGMNALDSDSSTTIKSHTVSVSKSFDGQASWVEASMLALQFPSAVYGVTTSPQRITSTDGTDKFYMSPYVVAANDVGIRGRLSHFFFAGTNVASTQETYNPMPGSEVTYNGVTYKLLLVNKSDASTTNTAFMWGPFGSADNDDTTFYYSPIVAVPVA